MSLGHLNDHLGGPNMASSEIPGFTLHRRVVSACNRCRVQVYRRRDALIHLRTRHSRCVRDYSGANAGDECAGKSLSAGTDEPVHDEAAGDLGDENLPGDCNWDVQGSQSTAVKMGSHMLEGHRWGRTCCEDGSGFRRPDVEDSPMDILHFMAQYAAWEAVQNLLKIALWKELLLANLAVMRMMYRSKPPYQLIGGLTASNFLGGAVSRAHYQLLTIVVNVA
ncbi:hypothetical protein VOLCADRAFT_99861 [Volvox carteri f. nagariensis]|uniref:Uncharacterized protein n=1 Tax=Volvox carteri f. nagariensis TaxID=3068 RepID=D8UIU1_VOLCA|nr:uncharacterized protein VOLCADRAFT_99861 [Volvox carteri f. nagariensis]EFJ40368.1 hypothetical protein VOLCADRAFT_99861 [Volvox carteri f. nagariensis]|eukprot:XP_002958572.1 hypothetical protein VOLCADRAFT_99861 [Volvox carteri f. nagariensis]